MLDTLRAAIDTLGGEQKALLSGKRIFVVGGEDLNRLPGSWVPKLTFIFFPDSVPPSHSSVSQMMSQFKGQPLASRPEIDPLNDVCVLPFSSGTTGVPKGVMLTHYNMTSSICQVQTNSKSI